MSKLSVTPTLGEFKRLARRGNLVPLYAEILADTETPVSAFLKVARGDKSCFLLESVEHGEKIGRFSFIGTNPSLIIEECKGQDVLAMIQARMKQNRLVTVPELPSFCGGFVGFLNYENVRHFDRVRLREKPGLSVPEGVFFLADNLLVFDHLMHTLKTVAICDTRQGVEKAYRRGLAAVERMRRALSRPLRHEKKLSLDFNGRPDFALKSNMKRAVFESRVKQIKKYIHQGDCIQVVFSQRFDLGRVKDEFEIYRALRSINPSPYMFYFKHGQMCLVGSSPELLVKKTGNTAEVRPIAGTRRRGASEAEDQAMEEELKKSVKEHAEHLMLVDLGRNDLGRVCRFKSVKVKDYARVERYSHVMHLVSEVAGDLDGGRNAFDLLRATFPAGTVSGAPKIRAMEIIDELEDSKRGPYSGCLGYFSYTGDMDMCIMIRTIVVKDKRAYIQAGAGIVYDSVPAQEYHETVNKAKALFHAVAMARRR